MTEVISRVNRVKEILLSAAFAHRGLHSVENCIPENSLAAFEAAIASEYAIELDVHLLKDKEVVVFHDETLDRMTGRSGRIGELTSMDLANFKLKNSAEPIPLLRQTLEFVKGSVPLLIEVKQTGKVGDLEQALAALVDRYNGPVAIQSFNPFCLKWFAKNRPGILRGQLSGNFPDESMNWFLKFVLKNLLLNTLSQPDFIGYDQRGLPNKNVERLRSKLKIPVLAWTIRSPTEQLKVNPCCDNIIFENYKA